LVFFLYCVLNSEPFKRGSTVVHVQYMVFVTCFTSRSIWATNTIALVSGVLNNHADACTRAALVSPSYDQLSNLIKGAIRTQDIPLQCELLHILRPKSLSFEHDALSYY